MIAFAWPLVAFVAVMLLFIWAWRWASSGSRYSAEVKVMRETVEAFHSAAQRLDSRVADLELVVKQHEGE